MRQEPHGGIPSGDAEERVDGGDLITLFTTRISDHGTKLLVETQALRLYERLMSCKEPEQSRGR